MGVVIFEEPIDCGLKVDDLDRKTPRVAGEDGEEAFDGVDPGGGGLPSSL